MANILRIKRSTGTTAPVTLSNAELAYVEGTDTLYYGKGISTGSTAATIVQVGGAGYVVTQATAQTITGAKTFSTLITGSVSGNAGTATVLATSRNFSLTGDVTAPTVAFNGSADVALAAVLANSGVSAGTYTKLTVDAKGRATVGAQAILNDIGTPTAAYSLNNQRLTGLGIPTAASDAATKQYVDDLAAGLKVKTPARVATTGANITLSGLQTIDGVLLVANDRVLVKDQTTPALNGIYVASATAWTRSTDADTWDELVSAYILVNAGTLNAGVSFVTQIAAGGTLGTTAIPWAQFSTPSTYSAGNGLLLTGTVFSVLPDGNTLTVSGSGVRLSATYIGQTSITTVGTLTSGAWNANTIGVAFGGTGATSFTANSLVKSGTTNTNPFTVATAVSAAGAAGDFLDANSMIDGGSF